MPDDRLRVIVRGRDFTDWEEVRIRRGVLQAAGGIELQIGEFRPWPFKPPTPVEVEWRGTPMLNGFVDENDHDIGPNDVTHSVAGRDRTGDLIDCSPDPDGPVEWLDSDVVAIARDIAKFFGITVRSQGDTGSAFPRFSIDPGETAWSAIERALRLRGLLAFSPGDGTLLITPPSSQRVPIDLTEGYNVERARVHESTAERFSLYIVRGQRPGTDDDFGLPVVQPEGRATDQALGRPRPLVIVPEGSVNDETATLRAQWEMTVRAAKAQSVEVTVGDWAKWRDHDGSPGPLWQPNEVVRLVLPRAAINSDWFVSDVVYFERNGKDGGKRATLTLVRPDAYIPKPDLPTDLDPLSGLFDEANAADLEPGVQ